MANNKKIQKSLELAQIILEEGKRKFNKRNYVEVRYKGELGSYFIFEHRLVLIANGVIIPEGYQVHHIDGNKANNDISNLQVVSHEEHVAMHQEMDRLKTWFRKHQDSRELVTV